MPRIAGAVRAFGKASRPPLPSSRLTIVVAAPVVATFWLTLGRGYVGA
ncbi:hypothetical protein QE400_000977 [Xanthomonas sacchari]|nr:hypothetical protein [Xanthomonas sacchari]MDQ1091564.1 hypothetical protein [Xanthomonas sacchari]